MFLTSFAAFSIFPSLLLLFSSTTIAHDTNIAQTLRERGSSAPGRELKAATKTAYLARRHSNFITSSEIELLYTERENIHSDPNFGATIRVTSSTPILVLEEFEHLAEYIVCQPGYIGIGALPGIDRLEASRILFGLTPGGLVITSHYGCNNHGERRVFRVEAVDMSEEGTVFMLRTAHASWATAFSSFDLQMYHTTESHTFRPHERLERRQDPSPTTTENNIPTSSLPEPTVTSALATNTLDINHALIDKPLLPANSSIQIICKNCSTFGSLDFSFVSFSVKDFNDIVEGLEDNGVQFGDVFQGGEFTVVANGLGARVELLTNISGTDSLELPLVPIPLAYGIAVQGIGSVGLLYFPRIKFDYNLNGSIAFTYGFEITVPDQSRLFIDITDPNNSSVNGFQDTSVDAVPFQASADINSALIDVSLRHQIEVGFNFHAGIAGLGAEAGVYLDLPKLEAEFTHLTDVDENCTSLSTSQSENREFAQKVLTDVYQIKPSVDWQVGIAGEAHLLAAKGDFDVPFTNGTIADIPSSCLNFNKTSGTYIEAAQAVAQEKKKSIAGQLRINYTTCWLVVFGVVVVLLL